MSKESNDKLKPCPFCGGEAEFKRVGSARQSEIVGCTDCHCELESGDRDHYSGSSWNYRVDQAWELLKQGHTNAKTKR